MVTGRHVFAGEDDEWETIAASSDKRSKFLLPWPILANLPVTRPHAEMYAQSFGKLSLTGLFCVVVNLVFKGMENYQILLILLYLKIASDR